MNNRRSREHVSIIPVRKNLNLINLIPDDHQMRIISGVLNLQQDDERYLVTNNHKTYAIYNHDIFIYSSHLIMKERVIGF